MLLTARTSPWQWLSWAVDEITNKGAQCGLDVLFQLLGDRLREINLSPMPLIALITSHKKARQNTDD